MITYLQIQYLLGVSRILIPADTKNLYRDCREWHVVLKIYKQALQACAGVWSTVVENYWKILPGFVALFLGQL